MGFGVSGATGILLVGIVFNVGSLSAAYLSVQQNLQDAGRLQEARTLMSRNGSLQIDNQSYDGGTQTLTVNLTNTGSVTFDVTDLDLLLDGAYQTTTIASKKVEGATTVVWPPQTRLEVAATITPAPSSILIVTGTGAAAYWRT